MSSMCSTGLRAVSEVLNVSSGRNVASETRLAQFILSGSYAGGFLMQLQAKDLAIADRLRAQAGVAAGQLAACATLWAAASREKPVSCLDAE